MSEPVIVPSASSQKVGLQVVNRVASYSMVNSILASTKSLYEAAKASSPLLKTGIEKAEANLATLSKPLMSTIEKYEPYISAIDSFSCRQLDRVETTVESTTAAYKHHKAQVEQTVATARDIVSPSKLAEAGKQAIQSSVTYGTTAIKNTFATTIDTVKHPINTAAHVTERVFDRLVPETPEDVEDSGSQDQSAKEQLVRSKSAVSKRLKKRALRGLENLKMRSPQAVAAMKYCVDLIQYAADNFDKHSKQVQQHVSDVRAKVNTSVQTVASTHAVQAVTSELSDLTNKIQTGIHVMTSTLASVAAMVAKPLALNLPLLHSTAKQAPENTDDVHQQLSYVSHLADVYKQLTQQAVNVLNFTADKLKQHSGGGWAMTVLTRTGADHLLLRGVDALNAVLVKVIGGPLEPQIEGVSQPEQPAQEDHAEVEDEQMGDVEDGAVNESEEVRVNNTTHTGSSDESDT